MARLLFAGAAAPLLVLFSCAIPVAEAPPGAEPAPDEPVAVVDSPIDPTVRPQDLPIPKPPSEEEIAAARARVHRLSPKDFPDLPASIADALVARGCLVPQARSSGPLGNVIKGEFFEAGREAWAVICSRDGRSQILGFRHPEDVEPAVVEEFDDPVCLSEEWDCGMLYGKNISTVDRDYIVSHYQAYGGQEPPPIDHHGIDVGIWESASVVRYLYRGRWLTLTGAD